jgi:homopolymeric O-antigen transport system ATP-binding protein
MSVPAIEVENISKWFQLGAPEQLRRNFREALTDLIAAPIRRMRTLGGVGTDVDSLWALKGVSFQIQSGEVVGIVGRNGAGKSTLLKILSQISEPTTGRIRLRGRVGSLLEVGTGFHPELTGRENIYLNGAILGMSRRDLDRQFDAIVDFAGVERFLETPVKRYSSGMYVRLAFAVAAHLNPEIMLVDEVLAVGDAEFQKKCLGKMQDVAHSGRTVLFVSHNIAAVRQLCTSAILLRGGELVLQDSTDSVLARYLSRGADAQPIGGVNEHGLELTRVALTEAHTGEATDAPVFSQDYLLTVGIRAHSRVAKAALVIRIHDEMGTLVSSMCTTEEGVDPFDLDGAFNVSFTVPKLPLYPGKYFISVFVYRCNDPTTYLGVDDAMSFRVEPAIISGAVWAYSRQHGLVRLSRSAQVDTKGH